MAKRMPLLEVDEMPKEHAFMIEGFVPAEELEKGFPQIRKRKANIAYILLRSNPYHLYSYSREVKRVWVLVFTDRSKVQEYLERRGKPKKITPKKATSAR